MKRFIYNFIPVPLIITDDMDQNTGAYALQSKIYVRPKYIIKRDEGIINHELVHVRQFYRPIIIAMLLSVPMLLIPFFWPFIMLILFVGYKTHTWLLTSSRTRNWYVLRCEVEAYRKQLQYYSNDRSELFAKFISAGYGLNISQEDALKLLTS